MSLKELIDKRNKCVADARGILDREKAESRTLSAEETAKADDLLEQAADLDAKIEERQTAENRHNRLKALEAKSQESAGRQTTPSIPGAGPTTGNDGASLTLSWRGRELVLRPGSPELERHQLGYRVAFTNYLLGVNTGDKLGLQVSRDSKGGYLAPTTLVAELIKFLDNNVFMRSLATVLPPLGMAVSLGVPTWDTDPGDADWTAEVPASEIAEDDTAAMGKREFTPHLLTKLVKLSMKLLRVGVIDAESLLVERLGYKFAVTLEKAYLLGNGNQQPLGVFVADANGIDTDRDTPCASQTAFTADELIDCLFSLKETYQRNATWLMSREGVKRCRKLKDNYGQYLWQPGIAGGTPGLILDRPYVMSEYVPATYTTGKYVAAVGDWKSAYWIADSLELEIQRLIELFSLKNQIGLLGRFETDGAPVLPEACARLKLA